MALLTLKDIHHAYGADPLLDGIDVAVERGDRVCLLGRNGEGKSTLMKVVAGELAADGGEVHLAKGARVARLEQEVPRDLVGSVFGVVAAALGELAAHITAYHDASRRVADRGGADALTALERAQHDLEAAGAWQLEQRTETVISRLGLDPEASFQALSGGLKRRVLLARALAVEPDLLLLDEPTNHLDVDAIAWLEEFLLGWGGTLLFVTHDRRFLKRLATRILELDRGRVSDFPGDYANYLRRRAEMDHAEAVATARFDKRLAEEEVWIRQGIKARRTRNQGRVRRLEALREDYRERRARQGTARLALNAAERSGKLVCEAVDVTYAWNGTPVVRDFSTTLLRGDKVGIVGPNGCGKSTLLNLLLGRLDPQAGRVDLGTRLEVAYFDQLREQLDEDATVVDSVAGGSDKVVVNGRARHVMSYLQDFLFPPRRARQPVRALSGGERNRLLLARLFTRGCNVLVLDEPTNDLDLETLELLEELLLEFDGTLLLVSHDRDFLDNVVTSTLVFEGNGRVNGYVGGYSDWLRQRPRAEVPSAGATAPRPATRERAAPPPSRAGERPRKLGYREQRELAGLPARIEALEEELAALQGRLADPDLYRAAPGEVTALSRRMEALEGELATAYGRWESLEAGTPSA